MGTTTRTTSPVRPSLAAAGPASGPAPAVAARLTLRGARAAYVGPALHLAPHRNAVATVAWALDEPFELALAVAGGAPGPPQRLRAAWVPPGARHHLRAAGPMAFLYLDALGDDLRGGPVAPRALTADEAGQLVVVGGDDTLALLGAALGRACARAPAVEPRVAALVALIDREPEAVARLADAAARVALSPSRCRALLREQLGLPFRRYRLWRRMAGVVRALAAGRTLTEAALASGFASSAHLSAAFKAMFGLAPSALLRAPIAFDLD